MWWPGDGAALVSRQSSFHMRVRTVRQSFGFQFAILRESSMPRLVSVNVGLPKEVSWQGRVVRTAIWKVPVEERRMVRWLNIEGDDQADRQGHGGEHRAVFVYQLEAYRYWQTQLGRDDFVM